jgi:ABC-2 type transport system permease protein
MISSLVTNPDSTVSVFLSLFPMTSPIVMLVRILVSEPPVWQIALCLALLAASVAGMAFLAAKIFRIGILMTGKKPKLKEVLRWIMVK